MKTDYQDIYRRALAKWGEKAQYDQAIEECAELIVTLQHFARGKVERDTVIQELADVYLMVGQLSFLFGEADLERAVEEKVSKLNKLMDDS